MARCARMHHGALAVAWALLSLIYITRVCASSDGSQLRPIAVEINATEPPITEDPIEAARIADLLQKKRELCKHDYWDYNRVLNLMTVDAQPRPDSLQSLASLDAVPDARNATYPRIFCYVNTISPYHKSHAQLVANTWAQRCDKTVFFSNDTGSLVVNEGTDQEVRFPIVKMYAPADYLHLWMKHKEVVRYIYDHYRHDFDWFYKADDDAYVVVDNLRAYLRRPEIINNYKRQPMHIGKRFNRTLDSIDSSMPDKKMRDEWWSRWDRWLFNSGGPGYAMNRLYIDKFVQSMPSKKCFGNPEADTMPEDTSTSFCMMWHDVEPWDTRDLHGRPRWHAYNPGNAYGSKPDPKQYNWLVEYSQHVGGYKYGDDCCAPDSIGFHYVKLGGMHHFERTMYFCRTGDDVLDIPTFNRKFNLGIAHSVGVYQAV